MKDLGKPRAVQLEAGEDALGQRIDNFLLRRLKGVPKSHVYRVLRSGEVRVNSGRVKPDYRLVEGDRIRIPPLRVSHRNKIPAKPGRFPIVYEDAALIVLDKPAGVAVHGGSGVSHGVIESLRAARPQAKFLELAHRLDRDTSGLLMIAKKRSALVELHRMLREGEVEKIYLAAVKGRVSGDQFEIREPLHKYVTAKGERRVSVGEGGVGALTRVNPLEARERCSVVELRLLTGRTHQIRVHLAHAGHPVIGDGKYGDFALNREFAARGVGRLMLHARRLRFTHPVTRQKMALESAPPAEFARLPGLCGTR